MEECQQQEINAVNYEETEILLADKLAASKDTSVAFVAIPDIE
jgi:hypothetical protein